MEVNNISFGAQIGYIPNIQNLAGKRIRLKDLNLSGYTALIGCDVFTPSCKIVKQNLLYKDKALISVDDFDENSVVGPVNYVFLDGKTVAPGGFDGHTHGGYKVSFHNSSEAEIRELLKKLAQNGTAAVIATTLPGSSEQIRNQIQILSNIIKNPDEGAARIYGIHLEGPFLSPEKKGIHSVDHLMLPTIENYESFNPENIKMVTLAPELDKDYKLTRYLQKQGIIVSAGHSMATAKQITESGIKDLTHFPNAMAGITHRGEPTIADEGLYNPDISIEVIGDKYSVSPIFLKKIILNNKPEDQIRFISDALPYAGIKEDFKMNGRTIHVGDDWVPLGDDGTLAGNMKFLPQAAKEFIDAAAINFRQFIMFASINPARRFGLLEKFSLKPGTEPVFSIWDNKDVVPEKTFIA